MNSAEQMKNVLIVDDEKSFLLSLLQGLDTYAAEFNTLTAQNGLAAVEVLKTTKVDLVVTDLKMPEMDGFSLLAYLSRMHPEIPVIVMSAYCTPEIKTKLKGLGAFTILDKPIDFQEFVDNILAELNHSSKGYIKGITLPAFLQLVEMERKTCTLRITSGKNRGYLYFLEGVLIDAEDGVSEHEKAALNIVCWDDPSIEIESVCRKKTKNIHSTLSYIILEGYRLKDEVAGSTEQINKTDEPASGESLNFETILNELQTEDNDKTVSAASGTVTKTKEDRMASAREILGELSRLQSVDAVCLVARDGFLLDSIARTGIDTEMIGAIASSGFGASESMGRQLGKGTMAISMIEFEKGPVMFSPVGEDAFLVIIADKDANLGMIRLKLKKHCGELALAAAI